MNNELPSIVGEKAGRSPNGDIPKSPSSEAILREEKKVTTEVEAVTSPTTPTTVGAGENPSKQPSMADDVIGLDIVEDESKYPTGFPLMIVVVGLCLVCFIVALDNTIIATAIPTITTDFNSLEDVGWYGSAYLLPVTALQPSYGKIYKYFDVKWVFLVAIAIFELGSLVCAAAPNSTALVIGRAVAGIGAAGLFSGGMTIIAFSAPLRKRAMYIGIVTSMFGIASAVGPILGGAFTDHLTWRWCFWINLPIGALTILIILIWFKGPVREDVMSLSIKQKLAEIDFLGATFLVGGIVQLLLVLQWGGSTYAWNSSRIIGLLVGFVVTLIVFGYIQIREGERATVPLRVFLKRSVWVSCVYCALIAMGMFTHIFYLPFYFQAIQGTSATDSGIRNIPFVVAITIASLIVGGLITVVGKIRPFLVFGGVLYSIGAGLVVTLGVGSSPAKWVGYQLLAGFGIGCGMQLPLIAVQAVLSNKDMPTGNAITIFFQSLGGAIAISVAQNVFSNVLIKRLAIDAPTVDPAVIIQAGATYIRQVTTPEQLPGVVQAYARAIQMAYVLPVVVGVLCTFLGFGLENIDVKGKSLIPVGE